MAARRAQPTATTLLRQQETRRNEDLVLAESSLYGERRVAWVRAAMLLLFTASQSFVPGRRVHDAPLPRLGGVALYLIFIAIMIYGLRRVRQPDPRKAMAVPFLNMAIDFAFLTYMG